MERTGKMAVILTLAVAFCFVLPWVVYAGPNDPVTESWANEHLATQKWCKNKQHNSKKAAAIPVWKMTQDGTNLSVQWVDATNARFAVYDTEGDNTIDPGTWVDDLVLDKETGLIWARDANLAGLTKQWQDAIDYCSSVPLGHRKGWRLPTREELSSLIDTSQLDPAVPSDHPFINVQSNVYWSSTTHETDSTFAWYVSMNAGVVISFDKTAYCYVWPVRGGNGYATGLW